MESEKWVQSRGSTLFDDEQGGTCLKIVGARLKKRTKKKFNRNPQKKKRTKFSSRYEQDQSTYILFLYALVVLFRCDYDKTFRVALVYGVKEDLKPTANIKYGGDRIKGTRLINRSYLGTLACLPYISHLTTS